MGRDTPEDHATSAGAVDVKGLRKFGRNPGWIVTGVAAVCYGLLVAFAPLDGDARNNLIMIGALIVLALFIAFFLGAFVIWFFRRALGMYDQPGDPRK